MPWQPGGTPRTNTTAHKAWARAVLTLHPTCAIQGPGCTGTATQADHIQPVFERPDLEYTIDNGQGVCAHCHSLKSSQEGHRARRRFRSKREPEQHPGLV